jgi:hypothetical protein
MYIDCIQENSLYNAKKRITLESEKNGYSSLLFWRINEDSKIFDNPLQISSFKQFQQEISILEKYLKEKIIINIYLSDFPLFLQYSNQKEISPIVHDFVSDKLFDRNLLKLINQYY